MAKEISSWKQKSEYRIIAPETFDSKELGNTFSSDAKNMLGRRIGVSFKDLTEDRSKQYMKLIFEVSEVKDGKAHTKFKIFQTDKGYLHSKIRKGMGKVDYVGVLELSDAKARVKIAIITSRSAKTSQKKEIMARVVKTMEGYKNTSLTDFVQAALSGKIGTDVYHNTKNVCPISRVEVAEVKAL